MNLPLTTRSHGLPRGPRVRLRLAQTRDVGAIERLLERHGTACAPLEIARMIRIDPRRRIVICASGLLGGGETLLGVGVMDVDAEEPELLCADRDVSDGLEELIRRALIARAAAISARAA